MKQALLILILYTLSLPSFAQFDRIIAKNETKEKMILAKQNADKYLISFFGDRIFKANLKWDMFHSSVTAKYNYTYTNYFDSVLFVPQEYNLHYKIYDGNSYVHYFYIKADSLGSIQEPTTTDYLYDDLIGYKLLLNKTFHISKLKALEIGKNHNIKGKSVYAKLDNNRSEVLDISYKGEKVISYYWEVSVKDCNKCEVIHIDPMTGKILVKMMVFKKTY